MTDQIQALEAGLVAAREKAAADVTTESNRSAYARERVGLLNRLQWLQGMDPSTRFVVRTSLPAAALPADVIGVLGPTVAELIAGAEADLKAIDDTLLAFDKAA